MSKNVKLSLWRPVIGLDFYHIVVFNVVANVVVFIYHSRSMILKLVVVVVVGPAHVVKMICADLAT